MTGRPRTDDLLSPLSAADFLTDHWPHSPVHIDGRDRDFAELFGIDDLRDFYSLIEAWPRQALVLPATDGDEAVAQAVDAPVARCAYADGRPVFFDRPETHYLELAEWISSLRADLGIPAQARFVSAIHASPGGTNTTLHFDHSASLVLQLQGKRVWTLWPSTEHPHPTNRYSIAMDRLSDDLADYGPKDPKPPQRSGQTVALRKGDVLFLPNGWWHSVVSAEESLALMFIAINYTWADALLTALRTKLLSFPEWRQMAVGARQDSIGHRHAAEPEAVYLLQQLPSIVASLTKEDLLLPRYSRSADARGHIDAQGRLELDTRCATATVAVTRAQTAAFDWMSRRSGSFTEQEVQQSGTRAELVELLRLLISLEYLDWK